MNYVISIGRRRYNIIINGQDHKKAGLGKNPVFLKKPKKPGFFGFFVFLGFLGFFGFFGFFS